MRKANQLGYLEKNATNFVRGFATLAAAEEYQCRHGHPYSSILISGTNVQRNGTWVTSPCGVGGKIYTVEYLGKSKSGIVRSFFASYIGA